MYNNTMIMVLSYDTSHLMNAEPHLVCESTCRLLSSTSTITIYYYTAQNLMLI